MVASAWATDRQELSDHRCAEPGVPTLSTRLDNQRRRAEHRRNIKEKTVDPELFARFRKCAVEVLSVEESAVVPEAELVMALEEEFDIAVPEEDLEGVETVQQAYDIVVAKL
jgi:acyl carrier protein